MEAILALSIALNVYMYWLLFARRREAQEFEDMIDRMVDHIKRTQPSEHSSKTEPVSEESGPPDGDR